jgi:hypothetical protein
MRAVNDERRTRLDELESAPEPPSVAELVRAFVEPGLALPSRHGQDGTSVARFIGRVISEPSARIRQIFAEQVHPIEGRYLTALCRALPGRDEEDVQFAYASMVGLLGVCQSGALAQFNRAPGKPDTTPITMSVDAERLIAFITAGTLAATKPDEA